MKTLKNLAELVKERERELAYGSETSILGGFVRDYDYVSTILDGETDLDIYRDETAAYTAYETAYRKMAAYESQGVEYNNDDLW